MTTNSHRGQPDTVVYLIVSVPAITIRTSRLQGPQSTWGILLDKLGPTDSFEIKTSDGGLRLQISRDGCTEMSSCQLPTWQCWHRDLFIAVFAVWIWTAAKWMAPKWKSEISTWGGAEWAGCGFHLLFTRFQVQTHFLIIVVNFRTLLPRPKGTQWLV